MRQLPAELKALLIDFDGTLVDSLPALWSCYQIFMDRHGKIATQNEFMQLAGPSLKEIIIYLKTQYQLSDTFEELYKEYRDLVVESYSENAVLFPDALEVLQKLKVRGLKLALVTSATSSLIDQFILNTNLDSIFDAIVTHIGAEESKPSPAIYNRALECLNVTSEVAIAVEDSTNGVMSAHAANIYVVQFRGGNLDISNHPILENASSAVANWLELEKLCLKILS